MVPSGYASESQAENGGAAALTKNPIKISHVPACLPVSGSKAEKAIGSLESLET